MSEKQRLISFGRIDKFIFIPIIGGFIRILIKFLITYNYNNDDEEKNINCYFLNHPFIFCCYSSLGMTLAFIPFIREKNLNELIPNVDLNKVKKKIKIHKFFLIIFSTFLDFLQSIISTFLYVDIMINLWNFDIIIIYIFSMISLKQKFYRHQYFSMISIIILSFLLNLINYENLENSNLFIILLTLFNEIIFCLQIVIHKYTMENKFCSPNEICFYEGLINLFLYIISLIIFSIKSIDKNNIIINEKIKFIEYNGNNYLDHFYSYIICNKDKFDKLIKEIIISLLYIILSFPFNLIIRYTIKIYTPFHVLIILIIGQLEIFYNYNNWKTYISFIILCFIFLMILIFNEMIELNFFNLQKNIKKNIHKRALIDLDNSTLKNEKKDEYTEDEEDEYINLNKTSSTKSDV